MKQPRRNLIWLMGILAIIASAPAIANTGPASNSSSKREKSAEISTRDRPRQQNPKRPATTVKDWLAQIKQRDSESPVPVTAVRLNATETGLEIVAETQDGRSGAPFTILGTLSVEF
ncbi:hypothetical protein JOY44_21290 [Phormidium sp. CLA17]|uniref:hypothetical protein n=1 Tax=Leptolyngbya sp. Cla-17 TaxID=2803751 RepID=UPI001491F607|nr:hypothetical protein [Leptolyngbya sp. Cla-17]MBM0744120.1 hypothetical protein [Leptolyngbya sp. Cla-17]